MNLTVQYRGPDGMSQQLWLDDGGNPPIPKRSWRIRMDLEQAQHEKR